MIIRRKKEQDAHTEFFLLEEYLTCYDCTGIIGFGFVCFVFADKKNIF